MHAKKILICGLPGSGKSTLARELQKLIPGSIWYDGDEVRNLTCNWSFDIAGRHNQSEAMRALCDKSVAFGHTAIASFVCPTPELRKNFHADYTVFVDRVVACQYKDTNVIWKPPHNADFCVHPLYTGNNLLLTGGTRFPELSMSGWAKQIRDHMSIKFDPPAPRTFDYRKPSALMIGRFQPWHKGHRALFEKALKRYGQVIIAVRIMPQTSDNPLDIESVRMKIHSELSLFHGQYIVRSIPNIAAVVYGRNVGYAIHQFRLDPEVEKVSATQIRNFNPSDPLPKELLP